MKLNPSPNPCPIRQRQPDAPTGQAIPLERRMSRFQPWTPSHAPVRPASGACQPPMPFPAVAFPKPDPPPQRLPAPFPRAEPASPAYLLRV